MILTSEWPLLLSRKVVMGFIMGRAAVSPAAPSALQLGSLDGERDLSAPVLSFNPILDATCSAQVDVLSLSHVDAASQ